MKTRLVLALVCAALAAFNRPATGAASDDGLVGYYRLDGDAFDSSGNGYNGVNMGVSFQQGRFGSAALGDLVDDRGTSLQQTLNHYTA